MWKDNLYLSCLNWAEFFSFIDSFEINTIKAEIQHCAYDEKMVWGLLYLDQFISNMKNSIQETCGK